MVENMVRVISLKVEKSRTNDVGQNIVRLDQKKRKETGVETNDAIIIRSSIGVITSIVKTALKHDVGKNILRLDEKQRHMLGVDDGSTVDVINYLDYKLEEEKLKPQPLLLKENVPNQVIYTQHYQHTVADKVVSGDNIEGSKVEDSIIQRSSLGLPNRSPISEIDFCPDCGLEIMEGQKFCINCGMKLDGK